MTNNVLLGAIAVGLAVLLYAGLTNVPVAAAAGAKNLKVYPKDTDKKTIKKDMKAISKALDVQCDYCHDMDEMSKDTKMKDIARDMMRLTKKVNTKYFKGKPRVRCVTCHNGKKKPK